MKNIIIFGATGNAGSYLTLYAKKFFNSNEYNIIAVGRRKTDFFDAYGIPYHSVDMSRQEDFAQLPQKDIHTVMLLAATIPSYMADYNPMSYIQSNTVGALNVLEYCRKTHADRILYTQTVFDVSLSVQDGIELDPASGRHFSFKGDHAVYVISKNTAVDLIEHYHQDYGLKNFIFRCPTIYNYSPFHYYYPNGVKTKRPLYQMIDKATASQPLEIWGNPQYAKDMVYVADFSQLLCKAVLAEREGGFYNVGTGIPVTLEEQIRTIVQVFSPKDNPSPIIYRPEKTCGGGFLMDISNAKEELDYKPQYNCKQLFQAYKQEMEQNRFKELLEK